MSNSQEPKDNMDDSESVASDESEEIIEVDEDECDRRRATILNDMKELENLFSKLKEALINEKQILIDQKLKEIEDETAEEFTVPLQKLKQNMEVKINLATLLKDFKCKNIEHIYQYEEISVNKSLENDKQSLYDKYVSKLESEIKDLEEKRRQFLIDYNMFQLSMSCSFEEQENINLGVNVESENNVNNNEIMTNSTNSLNTSNDGANEENNSCNLQVNEEAKKNKKSKKSKSNSNSNSFSSVLIHNSPYIVYSLQDYDILEDWSIIKMHTTNNNNNMNKINS